MKQLMLLVSLMVLLILAPAALALDSLSKLYASSDESEPGITPRLPSDQAWEALNAVSSYGGIDYSYVPSKSRSFEVLEQIASQCSDNDPILKSRSSMSSSIGYLYARSGEPSALPGYARETNARYTYVNTGQGSSFYRHVSQMIAEDLSAGGSGVSYERSSESIRSLYTSAEERGPPGVSRSRAEEDLMALASTSEQEPIQERQSDAVRSHVSSKLLGLGEANRIELQKIAPDFERYTYDKKRPSERKYAVVVGINSYQDRPSLRASVNDAEAFATLLRSCGYEVVEITDRSDLKPTKGNILEKGLGALKNRHGASKIVFYFSGHGETKDGRYYLIPQDANGDPSSLIDMDELYRYTKDLKNLVIVVDACGSANLERIIMPGQVILASSRENEASNEAWFGSLSIFTESLLAAMREDEQFYGEISLQRCFYRAQERTEGWSRMRLISQRPSYRAAGDFYLT